MAQIPDDLLYTEEHEYLKKIGEDGSIRSASPTTRRASWATLYTSSCRTVATSSRAWMSSGPSKP